MEKKKNIVQYHLIKILKKTDSTITYLANKNFMSFKNLIRQIDLSKITDQEKYLLENEIKINTLFNTRFILKIEDHKKDNKQLNIISEYFESQNLQKFLENEQKKDRKFLKEEIIWKIFIQLCFALYHIHNKNIIHRNIKPVNILLDNKYNVKLTNFKKAFALKSESDLCYDFNLNNKERKELNINPPEIILKEGYNTKSDIWNLGAILYEMCSFNKPFNGETEEEINKKILENSYPSIGNKYSKELTSLIDQLLINKQLERPSIKDIIHKYVFISRSKETNLYDFLDKIINPQKVQKKRVFSSQGNKKLKRPSTAVQVRREVKKSANYVRNHDLENKKESDIDILTKKFLEVKNNVKNLIGKEKAEGLFEELNDININEMINKYNNNKEDIKNTIENKENEKALELKKYLEEYISIMDKVSLIKNKE